MINLFFWPTPNGKKISIMLEECGLPYSVHLVNIGKGDQFKPEFLAISPNNRIPAIVDTETGISLFESGAILMYLAEKSAKLMPADQDNRYEVLQWLFWQVAGLGPMAGQLSHFVNYAPESVPYAQQRYQDEYDRLLCVMNTRLLDRDYLAGEYSIADIASLPWVLSHKRLGADLGKFPRLRHWYDALKDRPAVQRGLDVGSDLRKTDLAEDKEAQKVLFGQTAETLNDARKTGNQRELKTK